MARITNMDDLRIRAELVQSAREIDYDKKRKLAYKHDTGLQNELGNDLMTWIDNNPEVIDLDSFPLSLKYSPISFYKIRYTNPYFAECYEYARAKVGERIAAKLRDNPKYQLDMLPMHSTVWIEAEERRNAKAQQVDPVFNIHMNDCGTKKE